MDDGYATCPHCKWAGKLRKNGTMRKHRVAVDAGRIGSTGSLPQDPHGPSCKGSGEKPWEVGLPEDYELPKQNEHGGWERGAAKPNDAKDVPQTSVPVFCGACGETFTARDGLDTHQLETGHEMNQPDHPLKKDRHTVERLRDGYFAVVDNVTGLWHRVSASRDRAQERADELNSKTEEPKQDPEPSLDDYAKASRIIQSLIPGVRR
jgi:hypothetical protein